MWPVPKLLWAVLLAVLSSFHIQLKCRQSTVSSQPMVARRAVLTQICGCFASYVYYMLNTLWYKKRHPIFFWIDNSVEDKLISIFFVYGIPKKFGTRIYAHFIHLTSRMQPLYLEKIKSYWALTCLRSLNSFVYFLTEEKLFTVAVLITDKMVWYLH